MAWHRLHTSTSWNLPAATLLKSELDIVRTFSRHDFHPTPKSSNAIEGFTKFVRIVIRSTSSTQIGCSKAGQKQSQEKIEHLKIANKIKQMYWAQRSEGYLYFFFILLKLKIFWSYSKFLGIKIYIWSDRSGSKTFWALQVTIYVIFFQNFHLHKINIW